MTVKDNVMALRDKYRPDLDSVLKLERALGLANGTISNWQNSIPSKKSIEKLVKFFNVTEDQLFKDPLSEQKEVLTSDFEADLIHKYRKHITGLKKADISKFNDNLELMMDLVENLIKNSNEKEKN